MSPPERHDYLLHQLVSLRDTYALSSLIATGDPARMAALSDEYLRDAAVLMTAAYGRSAAEQIRASRPAPVRPTPAAGLAARLAAAWRGLRRAAVDAMRRNAEEWHHQTLGLAGRW